MNCSDVTLTASEVYSAYTQTAWSTVIFASTITTAFLTYVVFMSTTLLIHRRTPYSRQRIFVVFLIGLFPVFSLTSLTGFLVPRASNIVKWGSSMYLADTIYKFLLLLVEYYGGPQEMLRTMTGKRISITRAPLACFCAPCLPKVKINAIKFHLARYLVLQVTIIRPTCVFFNAVIWADGVQENSFVDPLTVGIYFQVLTSVSTLISVYGLQIFYHASLEHLERKQIRPKFAALQVVLLTTQVQSFIFTILPRLGVFPCIGPWTSGTRTDEIYNIIVVHEMLVFLLIFGTMLLRAQKHETRGLGNEAGPVVVPTVSGKGLMRSTSGRDFSRVSTPPELFRSSGTLEAIL